jgi:anti-anti-sigma factor
MSPSKGCLLPGEARSDWFASYREATVFSLDTPTRAPATKLCDLDHEADGSEFLLDLSNVVVLSTPALVALVKLRKRLSAAGKRLTLCNLQPAVAEVLEVRKLNSWFAIRRASVPPTPASVPAA